MSKIKSLATVAGPVLEKLRQGQTQSQVVKDLGISVNTFRKWTLDDPEFGERVRNAIDEAKAAGLRRKGGRPRGAEGKPAPVHREHADEGALLAAVAVGHPLDHAAAVAGIPPATFDRWMAEDEGLLSRVRQAEARLQAHMLANIHEAAENPNQWMAAAWVLERRFPDTYAKRTEVSRTERIKTASKIGTEIATVVLQALENSGLAPDDQQNIRERLARTVEAVASQAS